MQINPHLKTLDKNYLFTKIRQRKEVFLKSNPKADLLSLSIGDTTEPLPPPVAKAMANKALELATIEGYSGYGPAFGDPALREQIQAAFYTDLSSDEITISDGIKPDIARLQLLFPEGTQSYIQDPSYPVYLDSCWMRGHSLTLLPSLPENNFFPDLSGIAPQSVLWFCSPNNPTGMAYTYDQLSQLVEKALKQKFLIIYDAAYASFLRDPQLPRTIFEIPGAKKCAIELGSFSKMSGFTGVRLGWCVVPLENPFHDLWKRVLSTSFNGASLIAQAGGKAALNLLHHTPRLEDFYLENAQLLKQALSSYRVYGGDHTPFLWVDVSPKTSWEGFDDFLEQSHIITTPGVGFGPSGENFVRFSSFGTRKTIEKAVERLKKL